MASPEFASDMDGFDSGEIVAVDSMLLDAAPCQPCRMLLSRPESVIVGLPER